MSKNLIDEEGALMLVDTFRIHDKTARVTIFSFIVCLLVCSHGHDTFVQPVNAKSPMNRIRPKAKTDVEPELLREKITVDITSNNIGRADSLAKHVAEICQRNHKLTFLF